jgi:hypothetical protein
MHFNGSYPRERSSYRLDVDYDRIRVTIFHAVMQAAACRYRQIISASRGRMKHAVRLLLCATDKCDVLYGLDACRHRPRSGRVIERDPLDATRLSRL